MIRSLILASILIACGGKKSAPSDPPPAADHHEMGTMPPELAKFHDVLAPKWHAEKGPQRTKDTCAAIPDFSAGVTALAKAATPTGADPTAWTTGTGNLAAAVTGLDETCKANGDAAAFEGAFQKVHESFHALLGMAGGEHEHGEHEHGEHGEHHP